MFFSQTENVHPYHEGPVDIIPGTFNNLAAKVLDHLAALASKCTSPRDSKAPEAHNNSEFFFQMILETPDCQD